MPIPGVFRTIWGNVSARTRPAIAAALLLLPTYLAGGGGTALAGEDQWTSTAGPPGLIYAIALDPQSPGVLYAGTSTVGVFKSADSGQSWTPMNHGLGSGTVLSLALDPSTPGTLYAGTNRGVYRSTDGALSWTEASNGISRDPFGFSYIYALAVDPNRPATLYAGTLRGVFKSVDGAKTWQDSNSGMRIGLSPPSVEALAIDLETPNVLYAGAGYQGLSSTLFKTRDGGESWSPMSVGLSQALVSSIATSGQDSRTVYVATRGEGVFSSFDDGETWQPSGQGVLESHISAVAARGSPQVAYAAGMRRGFYRSIDSGRTWEEIGGGIGDRGAFSIALDRQSNDTLWLAGTGGLYRSDDRGSRWTASSRGIASAEVVAGAGHPSEPGTLYVSARASGVYKTNDGGATWQAVPLGIGIASALAIDPAEPNLLYAGMIYLAGTRETGLYLSRDGGATWQGVSELEGLVVSAIAAAAGRAYAGSEAGLYISDDSGATWKQMGAGLPLRTQVSLLALHPRDPARLYLTLEISPQDLYWSRDGGQSWDLLHSFQEPVSIVATSPAAEGLVFAATDASVLRSSDWGLTWQEFPFPVPGNILALTPHPAAPDTLYLGSGSGAYRSLDGGRTWSPLDLQDVTVAMVSISQARPSQIYAGTLGKGVYSYTAVPTLTVQPDRLAFFVEPEAPNPTPVPLLLRDESGGTFGWTGEASPAASWLSLIPPAGASVPMTATVSANISGLAPGAYRGTLTISSAITGTRNSPGEVPVSLHFGPVTRHYLPSVSQGVAGW